MSWGAVIAAGALGANVSTTVKLNDGQVMPSVNLGTCCGSDPAVGLKPWLIEARPVMGSERVGIDTAWDYKDQNVIGSILKATTTARDSVFLTTKIPTGFGNATDCKPDPDMVVRYMKENLSQLGVDKVDLALLHHPCPGRNQPPGSEPTIDGALWKGLLQAQQAGMVTSIGVSNYNAAQLAAVDWGPTKPAVNQCHLSIGKADDATIEYCLKNGIAYEAYGTMRTCYGQKFTPDLEKIAAAHSVGVAQVCLRWVLQRGAIMAIGTGSDAVHIQNYTKEDLNLFGFELTDVEMTAINNMKQ
jgi:diketogulonate reductase-like aldo/keto reductase